MNSPPQWQDFICSRFCFCQLLTFHQENWISPPQWQLLTLQEKIGFSTPVAWLHLFKNLLLSAYQSPPRRSNFSTPVAALHLFKNLLLLTYKLFYDIVWPAYTSFGYGQNFVQKDWVNGLSSHSPDEEGIGSTIYFYVFIFWGEAAYFQWTSWRTQQLWWVRKGLVMKRGP